MTADYPKPAEFAPGVPPVLRTRGIFFSGRVQVMS
jgi:hypothetical protein